MSNSIREFLTGDERDELIYLIDKLPSLFFGMCDDKWVPVVKALGELVNTAEHRMSEVTMTAYMAEKAKEF